MDTAHKESKSASPPPPQPASPQSGNLPSFLQEATSRYAATLQKVFEDFQRPYQEASQTYTKTFQEAAGKPEGFQSLQKAQFDLFKRLAEPLPPETGKELQGRVEEAYRNYLRDLQKALSQVDVSALDSSALVTVGQGLATAAYWLSAVQSPGPSA